MCYMITIVVQGAIKRKKPYEYVGQMQLGDRKSEQQNDKDRVVETERMKPWLSLIGLISVSVCVCISLSLFVCVCISSMNQKWERANGKNVLVDEVQLK